MCPERMNLMGQGSISLTWAHRGKRVIRDRVTGRWSLSEEKVPLRAGLETTHVIGSDSVTGGNLIIHGDCLLVCAALVPALEGRVSLVYADPPFNTGNPSLPYEDSLPHTLWLSFIHERLSAVKKLLKPGGMIAVHIGVAMQPYLRLIMDEIFGRANLISQISWQRAPDRTLLGQGSSLINDCVEYVLAYSNGPIRRDLPRPVKVEPLSWKTFRTYGYILDIADEKEQVCEFATASGSLARIYRHKRYCLKRIGVDELRRSFYTSDRRLRRDLSRMVRFTNQQHESTLQQALLDRMPLRDTLYSAEYIQTRGKYKGPRTRYYLNKQVVLFLKDICSLHGNKLIRTADLNNLWTDDEIPATGIAREGGVALKRGKKPEALLHRIIGAFSREGEMVLDPFAGSGTTGAVAHKAGRRWVMIDDSDSAVGLMVKRMQAVVEGTDKRGVTGITKWSGGGGFSVARLASDKEAGPLAARPI
jgi:adenine-specific DNA-methyltransferase